VSHPATLTSPSPTGNGQDWRILVAVFWVTSMVEGLGVSQIFALLPTYLREMGVPDSERPAFIGIFSAAQQPGSAPRHLPARRPGPPGL